MKFVRAVSHTSADPLDMHEAILMLRPPPKKSIFLCSKLKKKFKLTSFQIYMKDPESAESKEKSNF